MFFPPPNTCCSSKWSRTISSAAWSPCRATGRCAPVADEALVLTGHALLRHFRWAERAWRWAPPAQRARAAALVGRTFSPDLPEAHRIWMALQAFAGTSDADTHILLERYFSSQGLFAAEIHDYP